MPSVNTVRLFWSPISRLSVNPGSLIQIRHGTALDFSANCTRPWQLTSPPSPQNSVKTFGTVRFMKSVFFYYGAPQSPVPFDQFLHLNATFFDLPLPTLLPPPISLYLWKAPLTHLRISKGWKFFTHFSFDRANGL